MPKPATPTTKTTKGALHSVPCPHCGRHNDFRPLAPSRAGGGAGEGDYGLENGAIIGCDFCKRKSVIVNVQTVTIVTLRQYWR
jgi:hypothetical protein